MVWVNENRTHNEPAVLGALQALGEGAPMDTVVESLRGSAVRTRSAEGQLRSPPFTPAPPFSLVKNMPGIPPRPTRIPDIAKDDQVTHEQRAAEPDEALVRYTPGQSSGTSSSEGQQIALDGQTMGEFNQLVRNASGQNLDTPILYKMVTTK